MLSITRTFPKTGIVTYSNPHPFVPLSIDLNMKDVDDHRDHKGGGAGSKGGDDDDDDDLLALMDGAK